MREPVERTAVVTLGASEARVRTSVPPEKPKIVTDAPPLNEESTVTISLIPSPSRSASRGAMSSNTSVCDN